MMRTDELFLWILCMVIYASTLVCTNITAPIRVTATAESESLYLVPRESEDAMKYF
jgi:hypothetical protein